MAAAMEFNEIKKAMIWKEWAFFFNYTRLLFRLQFILYENIIDIYKLDYNWN